MHRDSAAAAARQRRVLDAYSTARPVPIGADRERNSGQVAALPVSTFYSPFE